VIRLRSSLLAACWLAAAPAWAGAVVEVRDPRAAERPVLPAADVKVVIFELTSVRGDERGKERARELHRQLLARIGDLAGGAVVTYVTPAGARLESLKVDLEKVAREQNAQLALSGRVLIDPSGTPLINARLTLITPPRGIEAAYDRKVQMAAGVPPLVTHGMIKGPVRDRVLAFDTLETEVAPLATFVSALARYYKADRVTARREVIRWLTSARTEFDRFLTTQHGDDARAADALLFAARASVRLADADPVHQTAHLADAAGRLERAAKLDSFDPEVPTAAAIVAARRGAQGQEVRSHLVRAATLAPADADARLNLAIVESAQGNIQDAVRQADNARFVHQAQQRAEYPPAQPVKEQLEHYQQLIRDR
jgi:hypothetical protein